MGVPLMSDEFDNEPTEVDYQVVFICSFMVVQTRISAMSDDDEQDIARWASENIEETYGFNPLDLCHDYEIHEV